jgi:hypothetical protein
MFRGIWLGSKQRYRDWRYWKRFGPEYGIVKFGEIHLENNQCTYRTSISVTLGFKNRDDRRRIAIGPSIIKMGFNTRLKDGRKEPHCLQDSNGATLSLGPNAKDEITYNLKEDMDTPPVLKDKVHCYWISLGYITFAGNKTMPLKLLKPFDVGVAKESVNYAKENTGRN